MSKENPVIVVIDYGAGNIFNVMKAIKYVGLAAKLTRDASEILAADGLVIPGVGAYKTAMDKINENQLVVPIQKAANNGTPNFRGFV
jgi:imidazole glycerol-phosphate synthase subunit HisH